MGSARVPPLNPLETTLPSKHYRLLLKTNLLTEYSQIVTEIHIVITVDFSHTKMNVESAIPFLGVDPAKNPDTDPAILFRCKNNYKVICSCLYYIIANQDIQSANSQEICNNKF